MTDAAPARFGWPIASALTALAASVLAAAGRNDPILGQNVVQITLHVLGIAFAALTAIILLGWVLLGAAGARTTGFQRAALYGLLIALALVLVLSHYGFDLTAVLTTSAILTAALGLALQPLLTTMIAGIAVQTDRLVRPGDGILHDGELVRPCARTCHHAARRQCEWGTARQRGRAAPAVRHRSAGRAPVRGTAGQCRARPPRRAVGTAGSAQGLESWRHP